MNMHVDWSQSYGSFYFDCIYGCRESDFESRWEAEQGFIKHTCRSAGEVPC